MKLEKIFETDEFIIWKDNKGFDFAYDIENKTDNKLIIHYGDDDSNIIEINDWVGLFADEEYTIECILNGEFEVL